MKILLVDDARAVVQVMEARLSSYGHDVVHAANGQAAVEQFAVEAPDLVLMDVEMPVMNGFEAASRIRAWEATRQWAWTPIIFLTSSDTTENLVTAIEAGGDDFMSKFAPATVLEAKMKAMSRIATLRQRLSLANQKLQDLATRDGLTSLANRRHLDLTVDEWWARACTQRLTFGLMLVDIDHFKRYNDHYGHQEGDDCLRAVAQALQTTVEQAQGSGELAQALVARYGGEEFCVVGLDVPASVWSALAQRLVDAVQALQREHVKNPPTQRVSISLGCTHTPAQSHARIEELFRQADTRLYCAKNAGRNQAVLLDP
jgi:diguanylate cyclase (GGDEF)-like protein